MSGFDDIKLNLELTISNYQSTYKELEQRLKDAKEHHRRNIYSIVASGNTQDEILKLALYAYVFDGHVDATTLAKLAGEKSPNGMAKRLKKFPLDKNCNNCNNRITFFVRSRTQIKYDKYGKPTDAGGYDDNLCDDCTRKKKEEWEAQKSRVESYTTELLEQTALDIEELKSMPYAEYLQTDHWKTTRKRALRSAGYKCELCNKSGQLHIHHKTYERRGNEWHSDLIALCAHCHAKFHDKLETEKEIS